MSKWAVIEALEDDDPVAIHIVPVTPVGTFSSLVEAKAFVDKAGPYTGYVTDEEGYLAATFRGHIISARCPCDPHRDDDGLMPMYVHRLSN